MATRAGAERTTRAGAGGRRACLAEAQAVLFSAADAVGLHSSSMRWLRRKLLDSATRALTRQRRHYHHRLPSHLGTLRATLQRGDVLLVDGDQRVSEVIKYLTQSSWSHSAIYVGDELWRRHPEQHAELASRFGVDARHLIVEALMEEGVVASPLAKYETHNLRVCRPHGLRAEDCRQVLDEILAQLGSRRAGGDPPPPAALLF